MTVEQLISCNWHRKFVSLVPHDLLAALSGRVVPTSS